MREYRFEKAYESVMGYAPEDVKNVLEREIPRIKESIDEELAKFSKELGEYIKSEVDAALEKVQAEARAERDKMRDLMKKIRDAQSREELDKMRASATKLDEALTEYENRFENLGAMMRKSALTAARTAGIPI